jgi:branched-subunit amino acid aminotransferase/4-amino-4-deoxychorismate lyase
MPCLIRILRGDTLYPTDYQADSLADAVKFEPQDGIYTVANTFHTTKTLKLDAHLDRMEDSARRVGIPLTLNRDGLRLALRNMILEADYGDVRFRVTVPHDASHVILSIEPFTPLTPEFLAKGVRALTVQDSARDQAAAKTTDWMHKRKQIAEALPDGVSEAILLDAEGNLVQIFMPFLAVNFAPQGWGCWVEFRRASFLRLRRIDCL